MIWGELSISLILRIVVVVEALPDAESHDVMVGVGQFDEAGSEIHVDSPALLRPVVVIAPSASFGWSASGGVVVPGQLPLPGLCFACGHLVACYPAWHALLTQMGQFIPGTVCPALFREEFYHHVQLLSSLKQMHHV